MTPVSLRGALKLVALTGVAALAAAWSGSLLAAQQRSPFGHPDLV